jgi:hypothetical protein
LARGNVGAVKPMLFPSSNKEIPFPDFFPHNLVFETTLILSCAHFLTDLP